MSVNNPSHEYQINFLSSIQRILEEGVFASTYKYALLYSLADLCLIRGDDSGASLQIPTREIANEFIYLYWRQTLPYPHVSGTKHDHGSTLRQNTGDMPAVIKKILLAQTAFGQSKKSISKLSKTKYELKKLITSINGTIRKYPLDLLQSVQSTKNEFIYQWNQELDYIVLKPGVMYCFRKFYNLITNLIRGAWVSKIRKLNPAFLSEQVDLESFLFGDERIPLSNYQEILYDIQKGHCFYCGKRLKHGKIKIVVDHFIPWSRYPHDLGHNFVLTDATCNKYKSDHLASESHLESWMERNYTFSREMEQWFDVNNEFHCLDSSVSIAKWAYRQAENAGSKAWTPQNSFLDLTDKWKSLLL